MSRDKEYREFTVEVLHYTDKAVKVDIDGEEYWIPWSVVEDNNEDFDKGYKGKMYVEEFWCYQEGIE